MTWSECIYDLSMCVSISEYLFQDWGKIVWCVVLSVLSEVEQLKSSCKLCVIVLIKCSSSVAGFSSKEFWNRLSLVDSKILPGHSKPLPMGGEKRFGKFRVLIIR